MNSMYTLERGVHKPKSMMMAEMVLVVLGLMIGASIAFYLCIRTMPLPDQTTIYITKPFGN